jgi:hypothetical protein
MQSIKNLFLKPDEFFQDIAKSPAEFKFPLIIVIVSGICSAITSWYLTGFVFDFIIQAYSAESYLSFMVFTLSVIHGAIAFFTFVLAFIIWLVIGIGWYFLSGFYSKEGDLSHVVSAMGWGMLPIAVYQVITVPLILFYKSIMTITASPEFFAQIRNSTSAAAANRADYAKMLTFNQAYYDYANIELVLFIVAVLCSAWLWIPAIQHTRSLSRKQAAIVILVPVFLYIIVVVGLRLLQ